MDDPKRPVAPAPPLISAIAAVSLDGRLSPTAAAPSDWTSADDKKRLKRVLDNSDRLVVGRITYDLHKRVLCRRRCLVLTGSVAEVSFQGDKLVLFNPQTFDLSGYLLDEGVCSVAVIGGGRTYGHFLERGMIDRLYLTVEPVAFGSGPPLFDLNHPVNRRFRLEHCRHDPVSGTVFLSYVRTS